MDTTRRSRRLTWRRGWRSGAVILSVSLALVVAQPASAADGAQLVRNVRPSGGSNPAVLTVAGANVFFTADDGVHGRELWLTDSTRAGTRLVRDIRPGGSSSQPSGLTAWGDRLFFVANDGIHGRELWVSDGTSHGTTSVRDIYPGRRSSSPEELTLVAGRVFFRAAAPGLGSELWASDGTAAGTRLVADIDKGPFGSNPVSLAALGQHLLFECCEQRSSQLWISDGTAASTHALVRPGPQGPRNITAVGDIAYFTTSYGAQLWKTDGTSAGTSPLTPLQPDPAAFESLTPFGDRLAFVRNEDRYGSNGPHTLWVSDGSAAGTHQIEAPDGSAEMSWLTAVGDDLAFAVVRYTGDGPYYGWDREIWTSDGTAGGTQMVAGQFYATNTTYGHGSPLELTALGDELYFVADAGDGLELFESDGTIGGTQQVTSVSPVPESGPRFVTALGTELVFALDDGIHGAELWRYEPPAR